MQSGGKVKSRVTAGIPEDAWLDVNEISEESEEYQDYIAQTEAALGISSQDSTDISDEPDPDAVPALPILGSDEYEEADVNDGVVVKLLENKTKDEITFARFFDIKIMTDQGEIEPKASVDVKIEYVDPVTVKETDALQAVHFATTGTEIIDIETEEEEISELVFSQGSFSVTGTIVTSGGNWPTSGQQYVLVFSNTNNDTYYAIKHDGTVTPVSHSGNSIQFTGTNVSVINDYLWTYSRNSNNNWVSYTAGTTTTYLKPSVSNCIGTGTTNRNLSRSSDGKIYSNGYYVGLSGTSLARQNNSDNGVIIQFATAFSVDGDQKITVHYVNEAGDKIAEDRNILETTNASSAANYHNSYLYGNVYDLYQPIKGYAYLSTHLDSRDGTLINSEVVFDNQNSYNYRNGSNAAPPTRDQMIHTAVNKWMYQEPNAELEKHPKDQITQYDLKPFANEAHVYVVYKEGEESIPGHSGGGGGSGESLDEPKPEKHVRPNGDGTYEMTLSVNASSKPISKTHGANVIIVFDMSASMSGNRIYNNGPLRLDAAKQAARDVGTRLLSLNSPNKTLVEMKVIPFDMGVHNESGWFTTAGTNNTSNNNQYQWNGYINSHMGSTNAGTNWEVAIKRAKEAAEIKYAEDHEDTYIIFITDGNPWVGAGTDSGAGMMPHSHDAAPANYLQMGAYFYTTEPARQIVQSGYELYGIGIYGNVDVLHYLMNFAYTGRSTYDPTGNTYGHYYPAQQQEELIQALSDIASTIEGNLAMAGVEIKDGIALDTTHTSLTVGGRTNGITYSKTAGLAANSVPFTVTVGADEKPMFRIDGGEAREGEVVNKTYEKIKEDGSGTDPATTSVYQLIDGDNIYEMAIATLDADGNLDWDLGPLEILENGATYSISTTVWPDQEAYDLVTELNNGTARWNDSIETEEQDKDGNILFYKGGVPGFEHIVKYPTTPPTYAALSNTYQTLDYYVVEETDEGKNYVPMPQIPMDFPDPMGLVDNTIQLKKDWEKDMMPDAFVPGEVTVGLLRDGAPFIPDIVLTPSSTPSENWKTTKYIAPGMMILKEEADRKGIVGPVVRFKDGDTEEEYTILNTGHNYQFVEKKNPDTTNYQLEETIYHPMLVGNDNGSTLMDVKIEGDTVTLSGNDISQGLIANNQLKGGINIKKIVQDSSGNTIADSTKVFDVDVTITAPMKDGQWDFSNVEDEYLEDEQGHYVIDEETGEYEIATHTVAWYRYYDSTNQVVPGNIATSFAGTTNYKYGSWFMLDFADSGEDLGIARGTVKIHPGYTLRFTNMAAGTTYSVTETDASAAGYEVTYSYTHQAYKIEGDPPRSVPDGDPVPDTGDIHEVVVNQGNNVTITNRQNKSDLIIIKADKQGNPITSLEDTAEFKLLKNTVNDGSGSWINAVDEDNDPHLIENGTVTINSTGGVELKGLSDGLYQLTEIKAPNGYVILTGSVTFKLTRGVLQFVTITSEEQPVDPDQPDGDKKTVWIVTDIGEPDGYTIELKTDNEPTKLTVANTPGEELPHTGGSGTFLYTLSGIALIMVSALMYGFRMRRRERRLN